MTYPLRDCREKLIRASEHFKTLKEEISAFVTSHPYEVVEETNLHQREHIIRIRARKAFPGVRFGLLIGDCIHNARASIDYLIWGLSGFIASPLKEDRRTEFPIYTNRADFDTQGMEKMWRLSPSAKTLIKVIQPYLRPDPQHSRLRIVNVLDILNKHKLISVTRTYITGTAYTMTPAPEVPIIPYLLSGPVEDEAIAARFVFGDSPIPVEMHMKVHLSFGVAFAEIPQLDIGGTEVIPFLEGLLWYTKGITDVFVAFLRGHYGISPSRGE